MSTVTEAMESLRRLVAGSGLSPSQIANAAGLRSANTVRAFLRTGRGNARTVAAIEAAVRAPMGAVVQPDPIYRGKRHVG